MQQLLQSTHLASVPFVPSKFDRHRCDVSLSLYAAFRASQLMLQVFDPLRCAAAIHVLSERNGIRVHDMPAGCAADTRIVFLPGKVAERIEPVSRHEPSLEQKRNKLEAGPSGQSTVQQLPLGHTFRVSSRKRFDSSIHRAYLYLEPVKGYEHG